jgi:hypothetical protein
VVFCEPTIEWFRCGRPYLNWLSAQVRDALGSVVGKLAWPERLVAESVQQTRVREASHDAFSGPPRSREIDSAVRVRSELKNFFRGAGKRESKQFLADGCSPSPVAMVNGTPASQSCPARYAPKPNYTPIASLSGACTFGAVDTVPRVTARERRVGLSPLPGTFDA